MRRHGAIDRLDRVALDIGIMSLDASAAAALLTIFEDEPLRAHIFANGLDLYREICCALGAEATPEHFIRAARSSGSRWEEETLASLFPRLQAIPFHVRLAPQARFLHFGSTRQLISSGLSLAARDHGALPGLTALSVNNDVRPLGAIAGRDAWVEGCRLAAPLTLAGGNIAVGLDVEEALALPPNACLDVLPGCSRTGRPVWFVRCYGIDDGFKDATFCGRPLEEWLRMVGLPPESVWDARAIRTMWNARVFPAEDEQTAYRDWIWMFQPENATPEQKRAFAEADRYSAAEIAVLASQEAFHFRRARIRAAAVRRSLAWLFRPASPFSSDDLAHALRHSNAHAEWLGELLSLARSDREAGLMNSGLETFNACRILHTVGTAAPVLFVKKVPHLPRATLDWLTSLCAPPKAGGNAAEWGERLRSAAFRELNQAILKSSLHTAGKPRNVLRPDETIWGRVPARLELGGGWTDTPPYSLEHGGDVTNVAINLNGQPPIHCYCRIIEEPVIRLSSIDGGRHVKVANLEDLLDYHRPEDRFALAKAALAISGFSPEAGGWEPGISLRRILEDFGGGIELTTLVGIPKGSGLGTSSLLGAVIIAVIRRMIGRELDQREMFHEVLRLEQALTTGGGWQDQIGGGVGGAKLTSTHPGMFPDPRIHYLPSDLFDPRLNGGTTLLYYTGLTRLAKNILEQIVGGYLNRDRRIMATLAKEHVVAHAIADAMGRKDPLDFGRNVNAAWELHKRLCRDVTNPSIESLLSRVRRYVYGTRISGAGSGGFLLMICKSPADAAQVRRMLEREPLNDRSRFFEFEVNDRGLEVTTC
jgi:galactokinase/mevalonate kinase-like predicted kinase